MRTIVQLKLGQQALVVMWQIELFFLKDWKWLGDAWGFDRFITREFDPEEHIVEEDQCSLWRLLIEVF
jgi:hypothetical protein